MNHDVFISYSSQDMEAAQAVCHVFEQNGIRCWMAPRDIPPGADYGDVIEKAILVCKVVVVLFSETASSSQWVKGELNIAFEEQKTIIPFRLDKTPLKGQNRVMLNKTHWIDAYPDYKTKFKDLVQAVSQFLGKDTIASENSSKSIWKECRKPIVAGVTVLLLTIIGLLIYPTTDKLIHIYEYDKQGLQVKVKGLSSFQEESLTSILDNMVFVEGGNFVMGNDSANVDYFTERDSLSRNPHSVELGNFYICKYEVTQKEWEAFLPLEGKCIEYGEKKALDWLSWNNAQLFVDTLSAITGLEFSLPTEAQWEYAARGGRKSKGCIFAGHKWDPREVGWTSYDELSSAHNVGDNIKRANELGLFDMTGNVSEWCKDYFAEYDTVPVANPRGSLRGTYRVIRGGDFREPDMYNLKITTRYYEAPFVPRKGTGMRLVINIKE